MNVFFLLNFPALVFICRVVNSQESDSVGGGSPLGECLSECVEESGRLFGEKAFSPEDLQNPDYDPEDLPSSIKRTAKSCRILGFLNGCVSKCGEENWSPLSYNGTSDVQFYSPLCGTEEKAEWQRMIENCFELPNVGSNFQDNCSAKCGERTPQGVSKYLQQHIRLLGQTGVRDYVSKGLEMACDFIECYVPCQADFYKDKCGRKPADFLIKAFLEIFSTIRKKTQAWRTRWWPERCESIHKNGLTIPSDIPPTQFPPILPLQVPFKNNPPLHNLLKNLGYVKSAASVSSSSPSVFIGLSCLYLLLHLW